MIPIVLEEEGQAVNVAAVDYDEAQRQLTDELRKDLKQICLDFDILPLKLYIDAIVNLLRINIF